jgi:DNA repair protein RadC
VLTMSNRILREYGEKSLLSSTDAKQLAADLDIPLGKAMQIVAAGELGRRYFQKKRNGASVIRTAKDVFDYTVDMRSLTKEHLRGLYLDTHYQVIHDEVLSIGTIDANLIHPREVFRPALAHAAAAVVLVHNHPSGIPTPSEADRLVTLQIGEAGRVLGIDLIDHVVVTDESFVSIPVE